MPLIQGKSDKAFSKNVSTEMDSGRPQKQALAIAYSIKRRNKKAKGGIIDAPDALDQAADYELDKEAQDMAEGGMINAPEALSKARNYELARESYEGMQLPEEDDSPATSFMDPKSIVRRIMMAKGGMINSGEALAKAKSYEEAKEQNSGDGMDNQYMPIDSEGEHDDMFSAEAKDESEVFNPRKNLLDRILGGIKIRHRMGI